MRHCKKHGLAEFAIVGSELRPRCKQCRADAVPPPSKGKANLVEEAGGQCALCGYARCIGALHFHHLVPSEKSFALSHEGVTRSLEKAGAEVRKCVLLCSNCHPEVEAESLAFPYS